LASGLKIDTYVRGDPDARERNGPGASPTSARFFRALIHAREAPW